MQTFDISLLEQKYNELPPKVREAIDSTETVEALGRIAEKHDLMLDQEDILSKYIGYVMLGLIRTADFVKVISKELNIDTEKGTEIAKDINTEIFDKIRDSIQEIEARSQDNSDIESAGNFTIEKAPATTDPATATPSREKTLNAIENPTFQNPQPINVLEAIAHNDAMADHMLSGAVAKPIETKIATPATAPAPTTTPKTSEQKRSVDPYREPIS